MGSAEEKSSELEDIAIETIQSETQREKRLKKWTKQWEVRHLH